MECLRQPFKTYEEIETFTDIKFVQDKNTMDKIYKYCHQIKNGLEMLAFIQEYDNWPEIETVYYHIKTQDTMNVQQGLFRGYEQEMTANLEHFLLEFVRVGPFKMLIEYFKEGFLQAFRDTASGIQQNLKVMV